MYQRLFALGFAVSFGSIAFAQTTTRVSVQSNGVQYSVNSYGGMISADGRWVAMTSETGVVPGVDQVYLYDRQTGAVALVSQTPLGAPGAIDSDGGSVSADGSFVVFESRAGDLVAGDTNGVMDVFLRDRQHGTTVCLSVTPTGGSSIGGGVTPRMSRDARFVVFESASTDLVAGPTNSKVQIYLRDRSTGITERVSLDSGGVESNDHCFSPTVSDDGRYVVFMTYANNLVANDTNGVADIFLRDRSLGVTTRVSVSSTGQQLTQGSFDPMISGDGTRIAFESADNRIVDGDANLNDDVFVRDLTTGTNLLVSAGILGGSGHGQSLLPAISVDGRWVSFESNASDLVANDTNQNADVFVRDLLTATTEIVSLRTDGSQISSSSLFAATSGSLSDDGRFVTFATRAPMVFGDTNSDNDIFVRDRLGVAPPFTRYCTAKPNSINCSAVIGASGLPSIGDTDAFFITATHVLDHKFGIFFWGASPAGIPFGGGTLCVQPPIVRTPSQNSGGPMPGPNCNGAYSFHFDQSYMQTHALNAGATLYGQFWSRDPGFAPPNNVGLTDAIAFTIAP